MKIATVSVGNYRRCGARYVNALYAGCNTHATRPIDFVCFTDDAAGLDKEIEPRILPSRFVGWWNKLALFHKSAFDPGERVVYFDLDTLVIGNIDPLLAYDGQFAALRDFYRPSGIGSGIMAWRAGDYGRIYDEWAFAGHPSHRLGDQGVIEAAVPEAVRLQDVFPGLITSFKTDCAFGYAPAGAALICFHGEPKPDNCAAAWVRKEWDCHLPTIEPQRKENP